MAIFKCPRDINQLAERIFDFSTGQGQEQGPYQGKNPAAVEFR